MVMVVKLLLLLKYGKVYGRIGAGAAFPKRNGDGANLPSLSLSLCHGLKTISIFYAASSSLQEQHPFHLMVSEKYRSSQ